ncbi:MAG: ester cyclase [archaeon]|nr:ester cyclase [archaeon]
MSTEQNKAITRRFIEVINTGKFDQMGKFVDAKVVDHNPFPGQPPGLEGLKQVRSLIRKAFPDLRVAMEDIIVEGDKVVARIVGHGTHKGEFMGVSPTGKKVSITAIYIVRVAGGKIVELWAEFNSLELMQQLGAIPSPKQTEK